MSILDQIIDYKMQEVTRRRSAVGISDLEKRNLFNRPTLSLRKSLSKDGQTGIIAEFKRRSPSRGIINDKASIEQVASSYARNGASALSVLTDERFFGGDSEDLVKARVNNLPILRKDFVVDEYQLIESKSIGADVILLIAACLSPSRVKQLAGFARSLGLEVLLELHDESEVGHICEETELIGINNRNLKTFVVDIQQSLTMAKKIPDDRIKIAESGIQTVEDVLMFRENGFSGFLIGELFMKEEDPAIAFKEFVNALQLIPPHSEGF